MVSLSRPKLVTSVIDGIRPINLKTDLAELADLIELVFADSMDSSGRAALREMRYLSRFGFGLPLLSRFNELALGIHMGYVWVANGRLVGNVSVYPAHWPPELGSAWIIANVGVHPDYQRRGIARALMQASLNMIRQRRGTHAILQVDAENDPARHLYRTLDFIEERAFTLWRRSGTPRAPGPAERQTLYIAHRSRGEWRAEMALAQKVRPQERGGLGWLKPLHRRQFVRAPWAVAGDWLNLRGMERLVIRSDDRAAVLASLWIENVLAGKTGLTLMVDPAYQGLCDDMLLNTAVRRYGRTPLTIEHPADETAVAETLEKYRFVPQRTVVHMRWDAP